MAPAALAQEPAEALSVLWRPQPGPQTALLACTVFDILYGGARGGGKTDGMLGEFAAHAQRYGADAIGVFFRRTLVQLDEAIERAKTLYVPLGAVWRDQKKEFTFPNGARLKFRYLERDADAEAYQGHSYSRVYFEELTNFPDPGPINKLRATLRSAAGVPCCFRATANPGGPGHQWVKARYIDPAPEGWKILADEDGLERVFIPARLQDNRALVENDPSYVSRLRQSGSAELVRAWLDGDWSVIEGAYFDNWRPEKHVIRPCALPGAWTRFLAFDWGSARPFACLWFAISEGDVEGIAKGALVVYQEWYGASGPNVGLKMDAEDVARGILARESGTIAYRVADPAIFAHDGGPSISERMFAATGGKLVWKPGDNKRVPGWDQVRARLEGEDGRPMLVVFSTCTDLIRTLPALQHDQHKPEDVDSDAEDHGPDALRYGAMSRPYMRVIAQAEPVRFSHDLTINEMVRGHGLAKRKSQRI